MRSLTLKSRWMMAGAGLLIALLAFTAAAQAQSGGGYDLTWNTIDGGGGVSTGSGGYELSGTAGQFDAGSMSGGAYTLAGGFWGGIGTIYRVYLPLVLKGA